MLVTSEFDILALQRYNFFSRTKRILMEINTIIICAPTHRPTQKVAKLQIAFVFLPKEGENLVNEV